MSKYLSACLALIFVAGCNRVVVPQSQSISQTEPSEQPRPKQKDDPKSDAGSESAEPKKPDESKPADDFQPGKGEKLSQAEAAIKAAILIPQKGHEVGDLLEEALNDNNLTMFEAFKKVEGDNVGLAIDDDKKSEILSKKGDHGRNLLHEAAINGKAQIVRFLLEYSKELGLDLNVADAQGNSPLALAAYFGQKNVLEVFNELKVAFDRKTLELALNSNQSDDQTIEYLISKISKEQLNSYKDDQTLLDSLVRNMDLKKVEMLLKGPVDINLASENLTPLEIAIEVLITPDMRDPSISVNTFEPLKGSGLAYQKLNKPEKTAGWAQYYEYELWARQSTKERRMKMIKLLLENGADVTLRSPFSSAAYFHEIEIMDELYQKNSSIINRTVKSGAGPANEAVFRAVGMAMSKDATKVKNKPIPQGPQYVGKNGTQTHLEMKMLPILEKRTNAALDKLKQLGVKSADFTLNILTNDKDQIINWSDVGSNMFGSYSWYFRDVQEKLKNLSK